MCVRVHPDRSTLRGGYVLLETVIATGLLIVGLAVIGAQIQSADTTIRVMNKTVRAMMLAEQQMAELDMGLIELDSLDEVEEGDFGPRHPDWAWLMTIEPTAVEQMYRLTLDVYFLLREDDYQEEDFEYDDAERVFTAYAFRAEPRPIDLSEDLGVNEEELEELVDDLTACGVPEINPPDFPVHLLPTLPLEDLLCVLTALGDHFGVDPSQFESLLPPGMLDQLIDMGVLSGDDSEEDDGGGENQDPTGGRP